MKRTLIASLILLSGCVTAGAKEAALNAAKADCYNRYAAYYVKSLEWDELVRQCVYSGYAERAPQEFVDILLGAGAGYGRALAATAPIVVVVP